MLSENYKQRVKTKKDVIFRNLSQFKIDYGGPKKLTFPRKLEKQLVSCPLRSLTYIRCKIHFLFSAKKLLIPQFTDRGRNSNV